MEPMRDFAQLQLHFVDQIQWRYELIRPLVLFAEGTATQRAPGHTPTPCAPSRVASTNRACWGCAAPSRWCPAAVRHTSLRWCGRTRLKGLYADFHYRELARILFATLHYRIDHKTVKQLWQRSQWRRRRNSSYGTIIRIPTASRPAGRPSNSIIKAGIK